MPRQARPAVTVALLEDGEPARTQRAALLLTGECRAVGAELLVVLPAGADAGAARSTTGVRTLVALPGGEGVLRATAMAHASGDIVVFVRASEVERRRPDLARLLLGACGVEPGLDAVASVPHPRLSVVVPVHGGEVELSASLRALAASDLPRAHWELIVVTDVCGDETALVAARHADVVVRLPGERPFGPAYARNRGSDVARGDLLVFLDADVCVRPDTLRQLRDALEAQPDATAVIGSYAPTAGAGSFVARHRNLVHYLAHQGECAPVAVFWSACGAVRREAFFAVGRFDEWRFPRPQLEDVELGQRLCSAGHRILLRPDIQSTHLKRWTLGDAIVADWRDVGLTGMRSGMPHSERKMGAMARPAAERRNTALAWSVAAAVLVAALAGVPWLLLAAALLLGKLVHNLRDQLQFIRARYGLLAVLGAIPLELLYYLVHGLSGLLGWLAREALGEAKREPGLEAFAEVGVRTWPPVPVKRA